MCNHSGMFTRVHVVAQLPEISDFEDEAREVFHDLRRSSGCEPLAGECSPAVDVYETDDGLEIAVDLPGVAPAAVRVLGKGDSILIAGEKPARRDGGESSFRLVERGYGRFARVIRLSRPCDLSKACATLANGELRVSIPKIREQRGRAIQIAIK